MKANIYSSKDNDNDNDNDSIYKAKIKVMEQITLHSTNEYHHLGRQQPKQVKVKQLKQQSYPTSRGINHNNYYNSHNNGGTKYQELDLKRHHTNDCNESGNNINNGNSKNSNYHSCRTQKRNESINTAITSVLTQDYSVFSSSASSSPSTRCMSGSHATAAPTATPTKTQYNHQHEREEYQIQHMSQRSLFNTYYDAMENGDYYDNNSGGDNDDDDGGDDGDDFIDEQDHESFATATSSSNHHSSSVSPTTTKSATTTTAAAAAAAMSSSTTASFQIKRENMFAASYSQQPSFMSLQDSLDVPSHIISSANVYYTPYTSSPTTMNAANNHINKKEDNLPSHSLWDTVKNVFLQQQHKNENETFTIISPTNTTSNNTTQHGKKQQLFCSFPTTSFCSKPMDSPITPEYEKRCRAIANNSNDYNDYNDYNVQQQQQHTTVPRTEHKPKKDHQDEGYNMKTVKKKNGHKDEGYNMKTVKKKNGHKDEGYNMKTVKKKNGIRSKPTTKRSSTAMVKQHSFIIADETAKDETDMIQLYSANENAADFLRNDKECYFRGFDGQRCHYTYVSPKRDAGLPAQLDHILSSNATANSSKGNGMHQSVSELSLSSPILSPLMTKKKMKENNQEKEKMSNKNDINLTSPTIEHATTILHVVSPKQCNSKSQRKNNDHNGLKGNNPSIDTSSSSVSMISEEVSST